MGITARRIAIFLLFVCTQEVFSQIPSGFDSRVVRINSLTEVGSGFITGIRNDSVFISTARHVILTEEDINVEFQGGEESYQAKMILAIDSLDFSLIGIRYPNASRVFSYIAEIGFKENIKSLQKVGFIGHPDGSPWRYNRLNSIDRVPDSDPDHIYLTNLGVSGGYSGGPVWNECGQWIAMIQNTNNIETGCLSAEKISEICHPQYLSLIDPNPEYACLPYREEKDSVLNQINSSLDQYISRSRDLSDKLREGRVSLFYGGASLGEIGRSIEAYNEIYEEVNAYRNTWLTGVDRYWRSETLESEFRGLMLEILDRFHKTEILPYSQLMQRINQYNQAPLFKRGKRKAIQQDLDVLVTQIENRLNTIESEKARILQMMVLSD